MRSAVLKGVLLSLSVGGLVVGLTFLPSKTSRWERQTDAGIQAYKDSRYGEAAQYLQAALREAEGFGPTDTRVATSLNNLAALAVAQGQYLQAEPLFQRAITLLEHTFGPEHPLVATGLENYAEVLRQIDRRTEARALETRARAIRARHATEPPRSEGKGG